MTDNGSRAGRGWAIVGAFAGQVGIFAGIGALLAGVATVPAVTSVSATSVPGFSEVPAIVAPSIIPQPISFPYTFSMYGRASGGPYSGVYPKRPSPLPSYTVKAGQHAGMTLGITLGMKIRGTLKVTDVTVSFTEVVPDVEYSPDQDQTLYSLPTQPLAPGAHTFSTAWPAANELRPGTKWLIYMSVDTPGVSVGSPLATVTVSS